jgi:hypothetical protein
VSRKYDIRQCVMGATAPCCNWLRFLDVAAGVPCVALFGNFNKPKWWHPMGQGHRTIHNLHGVREITPEEVYAAVCSTIAKIPERASAPILDVVPASRLLYAKCCVRRLRYPPGSNCR